ncbi:Shr3 amino acid permease chaperone [Microthyrium microscopicum]|uniref:Shr3 amino acid permease chaperone n=1 Tax=Microthyrium microscopicum TaxID=703497 RepID=A0A6A6UGA2_9PEZI|nr:Shr3 amino acid permease chaperone [Microthyrium microscopicum]
MGTRAGSFATFLIIGPTCFFLGILFIMLPYDYYVLWSTPPGSDRTPYFTLQENHLKILHRSPPLIARILHLVIGTGLLGFITKLYRPSEANMLFDGASLVLYMCGVVVYIVNIVKGMRAATNSWYGPGEPAVDGMGVEDELLTREDSLRVMAASNTILALVLVGVLVLQAGQWYAQRQEEQEIADMKKKRVEDKEHNKESVGRKSSGHSKKKAQ